MFDVHSMVVYRLATLVPHLDVTPVILYNNSYDGQKSHLYQKGLTILHKYLNIYKSH